MRTDGAHGWAARSPDGRICGVAELRPQPHDPAISYLHLFVEPQVRRKGIGTRLLAAAQSEAQRIQATISAGPPAEPFARDWRVVLRLELHEQRLTPDVLSRCRNLPASPGYEVVFWRNAAPAEYAPSFGRVMNHVLDAPGAALQMPTRAWDAAAVRVWEAEMGGDHLLVSALVHSGEVVAATVTTVADSEATEAEQHDTAVLPAHRGRGLARWLKARHTLHLHDLFPAVESVTVTVNNENAPMLAVNWAIGYRFVRERLLVEWPPAAR